MAAPGSAPAESGGGGEMPLPSAPSRQEVIRKLSVHSTSPPQSIIDLRGKLVRKNSSTAAPPLPQVPVMPAAAAVSPSSPPTRAIATLSPVPGLSTSATVLSTQPALTTNLSAIAERHFLDGDGSGSEGEEEGYDQDQGSDDDVEEEEEEGEMLRKVEGERVLKSGYLEKKGERRKNWKKRWFVLRTEKLSYYKTDQEYKLALLLPLSDIHQIAPVTLKKHKFAFGIVTPKRTFYVKAKSENDVKEWIEAINSARAELKKKGEEEAQAAAAGETPGVGRGRIASSGRRASSGTRAPSATRSVSLEGRASPSISATGSTPGKPSPRGPGMSISLPPLVPPSPGRFGSVPSGVWSPSSPQGASASSPFGPPSPLTLPHSQAQLPGQTPAHASHYPTGYLDVVPSSPTRGGAITSSSEEESDASEDELQLASPISVSSNSHNSTPSAAAKKMVTLEDPKKVVIKGYLMKMGSKRKIWRKRWFVLTSGYLEYFGSHLDAKPHRRIAMSKILDAIEWTPPQHPPPPAGRTRSPSTASHSTFHANGGLVSDSSDAGQGQLPRGGLGLRDLASRVDGSGPTIPLGKQAEHTFKIITPKKTLVVCAPEEEEEIKWLSALQALIARRMASAATAPSMSSPSSPSSSVPSPLAPSLLTPVIKQTQRSEQGGAAQVAKRTQRTDSEAVVHVPLVVPTITEQPPSPSPSAATSILPSIESKMKEVSGALLREQSPSRDLTQNSSSTPNDVHPTS